MATIGQLVRTMRENKGWSLRRLAQEARVNAGSLSLIENGHTSHPRADTLQQLAEALGCSVALFFAEEVGKTKQPSDNLRDA